MQISIMQPTFLPWAGYFDLIDQSDTFVLLDTAQFEKQSWQQRNRVRGPSGLEWLTVPVFIKGRFGQSIMDVEIRTDIFPEKLVKTVKQHYGRCPHFPQYGEKLEEILMASKVHASLSILNTELILWLMGCLGISTRVLKCSDMGAVGKRSERLVSIVGELGGTRYLSPRGSQDYLETDRRIFDAAGIPVFLQSYEHPVYRQRYSPFTPGASVIDLLFNEGPASMEIVRSGRRNNQSLDQAAPIQEPTS